MKKWNFLVQRLKTMDYKRMLETAKKVREITGKNTLLILMDMVQTGMKYQAGYLDYLDFALYDVPKDKRSTFITRGVSNRYVALMNPKSAWNVLDDKISFLKAFDGVSGRAWIDLRETDIETFQAFFKTQKRIIAKPLDGVSGRGIVVYDYDANTVDSVYQSLVEAQQYLVEAYIIQHPQMSMLHPQSVNTIRVVTLQKHGNVRIPFACVRCGNGKPVDNLNSGGYAARIDLETGIIETNGCGKYNSVVSKHPLTGISFKGFQIPMFDKVLEIAKQAALHVPELGYVGWDVAILDDHPIIIEGNHFPGHDIYQSPEFVGPNKIGSKPKFDAYIKELEDLAQPKQ